MALFLHLVSRATARSVGLKAFFTAEPCKNGHTALRRVSSGNCFVCSIQYDRDRWAKDAATLGARHRKSHAENRDARNAAKREYWAQNAAMMAKATKKWREENRSRITHLNSLRKKKIKQATPPWVDLDAIRLIYLRSDELTRSTGVKHHVDHIIPLVNEFVCGLHVPWNLQPLPWHDNLSKWNRLIERS